MGREKILQAHLCHYPELLPELKNLRLGNASPASDLFHHYKIPSDHGPPVSGSQHDSLSTEISTTGTCPSEALGRGWTLAGSQRDHAPS